MRNRSLRSRIISGFALYAAIQFFLMTAIAIYSYHRGEDNALGQLVQSESMIFEFTSLDPLPSSVPAHIHTLKTGVHELSGNDDAQLEGIEQHAYIYNQGEIKHYRVLQFNEHNDWATLAKNYALFAGIAFLLLLGFGGWAGSTIAQRLSKPMETLASKLELPDSMDENLQFSDELLTGETALVANSLDAAFERIRDVRQREHTLSRNISHELRTPLTVIRTALDPGTSEQSRPSENALASARRACDEMELLTAACLELAREAPPDATPILTNIADTIKQIVKESLHLLDGKQIELDLKVERQTIVLPASEALIRLVAGNMIRNAFIHSSAGNIEISLTANELLVSNQGELENGIPQQRSSGLGIGLSILGQACTRLGWEFDLQQAGAHHNSKNAVLSSVSFAKV